MKKRSIILYWLLILVPAVIISILAFRLLTHEQERINRLALASMEDRARAIAETLQITVEKVEDGLTESLSFIPEESLEKTLLEWLDRNPLVRNVFIWDETDGLEYPLPGKAATSEERAFMFRFDGLFSGRTSWPEKEALFESDGSDGGLETVTDLDNSQHTAGKPELRRQQDYQKLKTIQQELVDTARGRDVIPEDKREMPGGWIPWFSENRLHLLGWIKSRTDGPIYGVELELMVLLSRLVVDFPRPPSDDLAYAIVDDAGHLLHQSGTPMIHENAEPIISISLAPHLPHWGLAVYASDTSTLVQSGGWFIILTGLLFIIFITTIIIGGILLTWQAHRNVRDALQKTSFVSNVSHELKTPLTSIRMFAELLFEGRINDPEKSKHYLEIIVSESRRLTRLVNNILDFSRLEQGRKKYHLDEIDLTVFLSAILESFSLQMKEHKMALKTLFPDDLVLVMADRDSLEQVMINLIDNAIKYAGSGMEVSVSLITYETACEIRIEDRGPGVPDAHQHKIFDKFHRIDNTLTAKQQGSGLGLSIARRILRDLGGDLVYEQRSGGGSSFIVKLPVMTSGDSGSN